MLFYIYLTFLIFARTVTFSSNVVVGVVVDLVDGDNFDTFDDVVVESFDVAVGDVVVDNADIVDDRWHLKRSAVI